jgi:excisionase family DNA binding protein
MNECKISYTVSEFADLVGVTRQTVHRWINLGTIKTVELSGGWRRIPESEVKRFKGE